MPNDYVPSITVIIYHQHVPETDMVSKLLNLRFDVSTWSVKSENLKDSSFLPYINISLNYSLAILVWCADCLIDRRQGVILEMCWAEISFGVPQGSIVGSLLYIIYSSRVGGSL